MSCGSVVESMSKKTYSELRSHVVYRVFSVWPKALELNRQRPSDHPEAWVRVSRQRIAHKLPHTGSRGPCDQPLGGAFFDWQIYLATVGLRTRHRLSTPSSERLIQH